MGHRKKSSRHKKKCLPKLYEKIDLDIYMQKSINNLEFAEFIGHTVTIYVNCGGLAGNGFTGVILSQESTYVRLLILPATAPSCSLNSECLAKSNNTILCASCPFNNNVTVGSVAEILTSNIVAFVHNK